MSCILSIYTEEILSREEVFSFVRELSGEIDHIGNFSQGVIQKDEDVIWIYYRGSDIKSESSDKVEQVKELFDIDINTEVAVDMSSGIYSGKMAANFCIKFLERYPKSIVEFMRFIGIRELQEWYDAPIIEY